MSRIKQEKIAHELNSARSKLDGVLQNLMEKTDESPSSSDSENCKFSPEVIIKEESSPVNSPSKKLVHKTQRKRKRKEDLTLRNSNACVLKLCERSVDLAQFPEDTPLYPVCRSWIRNQPHGNTSNNQSCSPEPPVDRDDDEDHADENKLKSVYELPSPMPIIKVESGLNRDIRIPSPIPQPEEEFVICSDEQNAPSRDSLLANHMTRWRAVRQKWKEAAASNEDRYRESAAILKTMFERSLCREDNAVSEQWNGLTPVT